jgi:tight adherence protein C
MCAALEEFSALVLIFLSIFLVAYLSFSFFSKTDQAKAKEPKALNSPANFQPKEILNMIEGYNSRILPDSIAKKLEKQIEEAGVERVLTPCRALLVSEVIFLVVFTFFELLMQMNFLLNLSISSMFALAAPFLYLRIKAKNNVGNMIRAIPFFADLLTLSCEAGLDIFAALLNLSKLTDNIHLRRCLEDIIKQMRLGKSRKEALRQAYENEKTWELKTIYFTILQAESLGTPVGKALRDQVDALRKERMNRAEKHAQQSPIKILVPLLLFMFPVTFLLLLSPIILGFLSGSLF